MTEEFPELSAREQHLNWAETIIGPIFYDDERTQQLREDPSQLIASELGMRAVFLDVTYRELATRRYADRQLAKEVAGNAYDGPSFTDQWQLSDRHLEDIVEEHTSPTSLLRVAARQLTLINNAESSNEAPSGLRERQKTIKRQLVDGLQTPPNVREVLASSAPLRNIAKGISVKSPTGTGKSAMEGDFVRSAGIGQRARGLFPDRLRALNIVPSVALGDQVQGWRGKRTFQRLAGNEVTVTGKYEGNDDVTGDVVVATTNQVRSEAIDPHEFDAVIFDETQHLLGRQLSVAYREGKLGPLVIGYTATDEYGDGRHVGRLLPYRVDGGSIVECIKEGILNHAQLFSFRVPLDTLAPKGARHELIPEIIASKATQQAIDQAAQLAATGRRIAMYASPGGKSRHARYMADQLDGRVVTMPDGQEKILNAKAVGKFQSKTENDAAMEGIDDHTVDIIVATDMLSEGWDADIDAVLIIRRAHSRLWVEQVVGRGTRTSEEFPVSIYMEWLPILEEDQKGLVSICDVFDEDEIEQGRIFGPYRDPVGPSNKRKSPRNEIPFEGGGPLRLEDLTEELQRYARQIDHRLVREVTTVHWQPGEIEERLPGAIALDEIMSMPEVPEYAGQQYVAAHLQAAAIPSVSEWEMNRETGRKRLITYFAPEARGYLLEHPLPSLEQIGELSVQRISELLMISRDFVNQKIEELRLQGIRRFGRGPTLLYDSAGILRIKDEVDQLPMVEEDDVKLVDLVRDLGGGRLFARRFCVDPENGINLIYKRYVSEKSGRYAFAYHIKRAEADVVWAAYYAISDAEEGAMSISEIAAEANTERNVVRKALSDSEIAQATWSWLPGRKEAPRRRFPQALAVDIIERVRKDVLLPQLIPLSFMDRFVGVDRSSFRNNLDGFTMVPLRLAPGGRASCYEWSALWYVIDRHGRREGAPEIERSKVPRSLTDEDKERVDYALSLHKQYLHAKIEPLKLVPQEERLDLLPESGAEGLRIIDTMLETDAEAISRRLGVHIERVRQAVAETANLTGALPPVKQINDRRAVTDHFRGRRLETIVISLVGIGSEMAGSKLGVSAGSITTFMQHSGFNPNREGKYALSAWEAARVAFRPIGAGFQEIGKIATIVDQDEDELWEFLSHNGGRSVMRFNYDAEERRYLDPLTVRLALKQQEKHPKPPIVPDMPLNREEVAKLSRRPADEFDGWLRKNPEAMRRVTWYEMRNGTKVLPHVLFSQVNEYITVAKRHSS